jgi:hypothetical protein
MHAALPLVQRELLFLAVAGNHIAAVMFIGDEVPNLSIETC